MSLEDVALATTCDGQAGITRHPIVGLTSDERVIARGFSFA
jgi:hypothetical protein